MKIVQMPINRLEPNPDNPRYINNEDFEKLVRSIEEFPEMLNARPIVIDENSIVLGGNMRLKAAKEVGLKFVPTIRAEDLTEEQKQAFIIKDNVNFGEWDTEALAKDYEKDILESWGLEVWDQKTPNYDKLDDLDSDPEPQTGIHKTVQIEFYEDDYKAALALIKELKKKAVYTGRILRKCMEENLSI